MADYTTSKGPNSAVAPENAIESVYGQVEPLIDPVRLSNQYLFGIPLVSSVRDPFTNKPQVMTPEIVKGFIDRAVTQVEGDTGITIFPTQFREKLPFDINDYNALGYFQLPRRPIASIERVSITPANNQDVYVVPLEWIETNYLVRGQVHIMPQTIAISGGGYISGSAQGSNGIMFLSFLGSRAWIPAFWQCVYTAGFPNGNIPRLVNELIALTASMEILGQLAATNARNSSHSLGIDGLSQSVSNPGPELYTTRYNQLQQQRQAVLGRVKAQFGLKIHFNVI